MIHDSTESIVLTNDNDALRRLTEYLLQQKQGLLLCDYNSGKTPACCWFQHSCS